MRMLKSIYFKGLLGIILYMLMSTAWAQTDGSDITDPYEGYLDSGWWELSNEVVTPHTVWAKPYVRGKTTVLFILPFADSRAVIEFEQRMELQADTFMTAKPEQIWVANDYWVQRPYLRKFKEAEAKNLKISGYDVIVIGGQHWKSLPFDLQYNILRSVAFEGTGLVYINPWGGTPKGEDKDAILLEVFKNQEPDNGYITIGVPLDALPLFEKILKDDKEKKIADIVQTFSLKKGRIAALYYKPDYRSCLAPARTEELYYDFYAALIGRAILWAAGKEPELMITKTSLDNRSIIQDTQSPLRLDINNKGKPGSFIIKVRARVNNERFSDVLDETETKVEIPAGFSVIDINSPHFPAGQVFIDAFILKEGKVVDWCSRIVMVEHSERKIVSVEEPDEIHSPSSTVPLTLKMEGTPVQGLKLTCEMEDIYGRLLEYMETDILEQPSIEIKVPLKRVIGNQMWVTFLLKRAGKVEQVIYHRVYRADTRIPDFVLAGWMGGFYLNDNAVWTRGAYRQAGKAGVNVAGQPMPYRQHAPYSRQRGVMGTDAGLKLNPFVTRITLSPFADRNPGATESPECFNNPDFLAKTAETFKKFVRDYAQFGSPVYNLGDENCLGWSKENDLCRCRYCLEGFRNALKKEYPDLFALNREWQTDFKNWEEVVPLTLSQAREKNNFASWADHRAYMETTFAEMHGFYSDIIRDIAGPNVLTLAEGLSDFRHCVGIDWIKLMQKIDIALPYSKNASLALSRDLGSRNNMTGNISGFYSSRPGTGWQRYGAEPWHTLARGGRMILFWNVYTPMLDQTHAIMPDLRATTQLKWIGESVREINAGPGRLLKDSNRIYDPVAILYSRMSIRAGEFSGHFGGVYKSMEILSTDTNLLLGLTPRFISGEQLLDEVFMKQFRILVLPYSQAISDSTAKAIEKFVVSGGTVIADVRPGVFTGHCASRASGILDNLFGVVQSKEAFQVNEKLAADWIAPDMGKEITMDELLLDAAITGSVVKTEQMVGIRSDGALKVTQGKASLYLPHTNTPVLIENSYGKGRAILLNMQNCAEILPLWRKLYARAGVESSVRAVSDKGNEIARFRRDRFSDGPAEYYMISEGPDVEANILLPHKAHIYEIREGKYLGHTDKVRLNLQGPWMLALLPAKTVQVVVSVPENVRAGNDLSGSFRLLFSEGPSFRRVGRVDLYDPDGQWLEHYQALVETSDGRGEFSIPLALNERPGRYKLVVTDTATSVTEEQYFIIEE
jgi:hypothetical protein